MKKTTMLEVACSGIMAVSNVILMGCDIASGESKRRLGLGLAATSLSALSFGLQLTSYIYQHYYKPEYFEEDAPVIPEIVEPAE